MKVTLDMLEDQPSLWSLQSAIERQLADSYDRRFWYQIRTGKCGAIWHGYICDLPADHSQRFHFAVDENNGDPVYITWL